MQLCSAQMLHQCVSGQRDRRLEKKINFDISHLSYFPGVRRRTVLWSQSVERDNSSCAGAGNFPCRRYYLK